MQIPKITIISIPLSPLLPIVTLLLLLPLSTPQPSPPCLIPNCLACSSPYTCTSCPTNLTCCQQECTECRFETMCGLCVTGWTFNDQVQMCQLDQSCLQPACLGCDLGIYPDGACTGCVQGFYYDQGTYQCVKCPPRCEICTITGACLACELSYYLTPLGQCQSCNPPGSPISHCLLCTNTSVCLQCAPGYTASVYGCTTDCPLHCQYCHQTQTVCLICSQGYFLTAALRCSPCASACTNCLGLATNCTVCQIDEYLSGGGCLGCFTMVPYCLTCGANGTTVECLSCVQGMFLNASTNTCQKCSQACSQCTDPNTCTSCVQAYYLNSSTCLPCNIPYCQICSSPTSCQFCGSGLSPTPDSTACLQCPQNCIHCKTASNCTICNFGYTVVGGACVPCTANCYDCVKDPAVCLFCNQNFYQLQSTFLVSHTCLPCPLYCPQCFSPQRCANCSNGYYSISQICQPCQIQNCFNCNTSTPGLPTCTLCNNGYYLSTNTNSSGTQCLACSAGCLVCEGAACLLCMGGYWLNQGECGVCPIEHCVVCISSYVCQVCEPGYYNIQDAQLCYNCPTGCSNCTSSSSCQTCSPGFYLTTPATPNHLTTCQPCSVPCLTCTSASPSACISCQPHYGLNYGICSPCPEDCLVCDFVEGCQQCVQGYALVYEGDVLVCRACMEGCVLCSSVVNVELKQSTVYCVSCGFGTISTQSQSCFKCGSNNATQGCQICQSENECQTCIPSWTLANGICTNSNRQLDYTKQWNYIGAMIGLGCLAMLLIIVALYLRLAGQVRPSGFRGEMGSGGVGLVGDGGRMTELVVPV